MLIPADPRDASQKSSFILATRLHPEHEAQNDGSRIIPGIQQIIVLSSVGKACILCNFTLTFYALPELSPAFSGSIKVSKCSWVGGTDLNDPQGGADGEGIVIMICVEERIRLVRIGEKAKGVRAIELGGCLAVARRGGIACVADGSAYSLIDVVERQKIPLFDISSSSMEEVENEDLKDVQDESQSHPAPVTSSQQEDLRPSSSGSGAVSAQEQAQESQSEGFHEQQIQMIDDSEIQQADLPQRSSSFGKPIASDMHQQDNESSQSEYVRHDRDTSRPSKRSQDITQQAMERRKAGLLRPHILSPTPAEFLLTTGTSASEAGVGIFVNVDGDVVRGTIEFGKYPEAIAVDGAGGDSASSITPRQRNGEGFVLAVVDRVQNGLTVKGIEIQRWDLDTTETHEKHWLGVKSQSPVHGHVPAVGLRSAESPGEIPLKDVTERLRLRQYKIERDPAPETRSLTANSNTSTSERERAEAEFVNRISISKSRLLVWCRNSIWWAVRSSLAIRLDSRLEQACSPMEQDQGSLVNRSTVEKVIEVLQGSEQQTELDFLSIKYIRQKASLLLFADLVKTISSRFMTYDRDRKLTLEALVEGEVDPRIILSLVPVLRSEIGQTHASLWLQAGLLEILEKLFPVSSLPDKVSLDDPYGSSLFPLVKQYLYFWRRKKGFGSVADENEVFLAVDAALLHLLLLLDSQTPRGPATKGSVRAELGGLIDSGLDCFDRAIQLLQEFQRPYMLSRLYQSRRNYSKVLETWQRIVEGGPDKGGEFEDGEEKIRKYLSERKDRQLVERYGTWLAARNPKIGVRVFADRKNQTRFDPREAIKILKEKASDAVKDFLEHLVFNNNVRLAS